MFLVPLPARERRHQNRLGANGPRVVRVLGNVGDKRRHVGFAAGMPRLIVMAELDEIVIAVERERVRPAAFAHETHGTAPAARGIDQLDLVGVEKLLEAKPQPELSCTVESPTRTILILCAPGDGTSAARNVWTLPARSRPDTTIEILFIIFRDKPAAKTPCRTSDRSSCRPLNLIPQPSIKRRWSTPILWISNKISNSLCQGVHLTSSPGARLSQRVENPCCSVRPRRPSRPRPRFFSEFRGRGRRRERGG